MKTLYENFFTPDLSKNPILSLLSKIPVFENLSPKELKEVSRMIHDRTYKKDESVFKKMAPAEGMYVIINGKVEIKDPDNGFIFTTLSSGDFFGELALLDEDDGVAWRLFEDLKIDIEKLRADVLVAIGADAAEMNAVALVMGSEDDDREYSLEELSLIHI